MDNDQVNTMNKNLADIAIGLDKLAGTLEKIGRIMIEGNKGMTEIIGETDGETMPCTFEFCHFFNRAFPGNCSDNVCQNHPDLCAFYQPG